MSKQKNVQIPVELFADLVHYFILDEETPEANQHIREQLKLKLEAMEKRELYNTYKTAENPEEAEKARQAYLDISGILDSFRW